MHSVEARDNAVRSGASGPPCQTQQPDPEPPPPEPRLWQEPAFWFIVGLLVATALFEWWMVRTRRRTVSRFTKKYASRRWWWKVLWTSLTALLIWHLLEGGPI